MMIGTCEKVRSPWVGRWWRGAFALLFAAVMVLEAAPGVSASALNLLSEGVNSALIEPVAPERILVTGSPERGDVTLGEGRKVAIRQGDRTRYATSRAGESVSALLCRQGVSVGPLELVRLDLSGSDVLLEVGADFTYYETEVQAAAYRTLSVTDYTLPKGETRVTQQGVTGEREVVYEVVYADGAFVSRQAVAEGGSTAVDQIVSTGTLVKEARPGDTISSVVKTEDGGGYLLLKSGDSLRFTGIMNMTCTAYTANVGKVGTITATGTHVRPGVAAVDRSVIPLGTRMFVTTEGGAQTYGMATAEDTGVRGRILDLYMNTYQECKQFGLRPGVVYILAD